MTNSPNMVEVWLRLMNDAMRGTTDAQEAIRALSEGPMTPDQVARWVMRVSPMLATTSSAKPEAFNDWLEGSWQMMGVVPRYRYLELLERHELLRLRLEEAEKKLQSMRKTMPVGAVPEKEAQQILDMWQNMLHETVKMQTDWMRNWTAADGEPDKPGEAATRPEASEADSKKD